MPSEGKKSLFTSDNKELWPGLRILVVKTSRFQETYFTSKSYFICDRSEGRSLNLFTKYIHF